MQALIIGASGQVGQALISALKLQNWAWRGTGHTQPGTPEQKLVPLDICQTETLRNLIAAKPVKAVFFPAGWTWVDGCEDDPQKARLINSLAAEAAAQEARKQGAAFVYYSTEYVFDGDAGPYEESSATKPQGVYAKSKLEGEERVLKAHPDALIIRTTVVYGPEPQEKNFIYQLLKNLRAGKSMAVPADQISNPTYNYDLARASVELVRFGKAGIWNVVGSDRVSRLEFAHKACLVFGLDAALLRGVRTPELGQKAPRPLNAGLTNFKLASELGWRPRGILDGLHAMKAALEKENSSLVC